MNEIIPRATIEDLVAHRNHAVELYRAAFGKIAEANDAMKEAHAATLPFKAEVYPSERHQEIAAFQNAVKLPDAAEFMYVAQRLTDIQFWTWLVERGDLQRLMDKEAKQNLQNQLAYQPIRRRREWGEEPGREMIDEEEIGKSFPPVTVENVVATVQSFMGEADMIFRRGVANAFSKLDRRFRSHDGFKIGSRVILDWLFSRDGSYYCRGDKFDTLQDIERAFAVLDGKPGSSFTSAQWAIDRATRGFRYGDRQQFEVNTEYFKIRVFKNGNAHLWMQNKDLVGKVNRLLAEYYGEVIPDGQTQEDMFRKTSGPLAVRDFDLFPTPPDVADKVISAAKLYQDEGSPALRVLEPSAGLGNLAIRAVGEGCKVDCVEIHPDRANGLRKLDGVGAVYQMDFLKLQPSTTGLYDRIVMNPPFTGERDIDHVIHALKFLKPGGYLVSVMSAGTEFRETNKATAFRDLAQKLNGNARNYYRNQSPFEDLPAGSFKDVGTMINTVVVTIRTAETSKAAKAA